MSPLRLQLSDPKLWLGLATLIVVLVLVAHETERTSPGPLTSAHAALAELSGKGSCARCHPARGELADACSACHPIIAAQIAERRGFHGALADVDPRSCPLCHVEHHGDEARLVDRRAFALAGVAELAEFQHAFTAFELSGAHARLECAQCHRNAELEQLAKGQVRYLGLTQRCADCHEDPHQGKFDNDCSKCHGQESFESLEHFRHTERFELVGRHAGLDCQQCHAPDGPFAVEVVGAAGYAGAPRVCQDCHASPHAPSFVGQVAAALRVRAEASCGECHAALDGSFAARGARMAREFHAASGFPLRGKHAQVDCAGCHDAEATPGRAPSEDFRARFPGSRAERCESCHTGPHGEQFATPPAAACADCHVEEGWAPSTVTRAAHPGFELTGAHLRADCAACHLPADGGTRGYRGTPSRCESCHDDAHEAAFERRLALAASEVRAAGGACGLCHTTGRFDEVAAQRFDHAHWTGFELAGAHARASCEACHRPSAVADEHGRRFGRVARVPPRPATDCANCHRDAHRGAFDGLDVVDPERGVCAQCHGVESFRPARAGFDHAHTGFALDGAHASARCEQCHGPSPVRADPARQLGFVADLRPASTDVHRSAVCATCHADAHSFSRADAEVDAGRAQQARECATCHTTSAFAQVERSRFDHASWTGFPLEGAHGATACEACHVPLRERDGLGRRFGRAAGSDCSACHVDVHAGQFARAGGTDCSRCHDPARPVREVSFDHQRDSRFALDANHLKLACSACHRPQPTPDGRLVVRYKPLGLACADCHGVSGGRR